MRHKPLQVSVIALIGAFYALPITYYATKILRVCGILPGQSNVIFSQSLSFPYPQNKIRFDRILERER